MRGIISVSWNDILINSGAIVIKDPKIKNIVYGTIWKLHQDINPESREEKITFEKTDPYLSPNITMLSEEGKILVEKFNKYLKTAYAVINEADELSIQIRNQHIDISKMMQNSDNLFTEEKVNPLDHSNIIRAAKSNLNKIKKEEK